MAPRSRWVRLLHSSVFTHAFMQLFCLASIPGHKNEGQKQEPDSPAQSLAEIIFLQLRKFTLTQPRQVSESRSSRPPSLLALPVSQLLSCLYPPASLLLPQPQGDVGSLLCVCWLLSLCFPRTVLPWTLGWVYLSISQVSACTLWSATES